MKLLAVVTFALVVAGCSSKEKRLEQREKISKISGMYCEYIDGDVYSDIDVELNLQMGKRCDSARPYSISNYKNASEDFGVIFCCTLTRKDTKTAQAQPVAAAPATQVPAAETPAAVPDAPARDPQSVQPPQPDKKNFEVLGQ